jgi:hypothetical protein
VWWQSEILNFSGSFFVIMHILKVKALGDWFDECAGRSLEENKKTKNGNRNSSIEWLVER